MKSKRILSAILAAVMTLSFVGCGKKENKKISGDIEQPSFENGTAVVEYPSVDADGNEVIQTTVIETPSEYQDEDVITTANNGSAEGNTSAVTEKSDSKTKKNNTEASTVAQQAAVKVMFTNPLSNTLESEEAKQDFITRQSNFYNISTEDAKKVVANSDKWTGFECKFYIVNTNKQRLSTKEIQAESNGDIIIDKNLDCEFNVRSGYGMTIAVYGYVNTEKYADDEALIAALNNSNIQLVYALTDDTCIDDWSKVTTKTIKITL